MSRRCAITGKTRQHGHRVSHANNKTKHVFKANLQTRRLWVPEEGKYVTVKVSTRALRTLDKLGVAGALKKYKLTLDDIRA